MRNLVLSWSEKRRVATGMALTLALVGTGCSVSMRHGPLDAPPRTYAGTVQTRAKSEGIDGKVGWGRFTVFAIPVVPVYIDGDGNEKIMEQIHDALRRAGYTTTTAASTSAEAGPVLTCSVKKFWFGNYTWLFPFVPTWGGVELNTSLVSPAGTVVWTRDFSGSGFSANFFDGYSGAAESSMTTILNAMVREFASDDFHQALNGAAS